jgi:hypothetical protein
MGIGNCRVPVTTAVASKLYWTVSVPRLTYGIAVADVPEGAIDSLEQHHGSVAKRFQGMSSQTANSACLATLGWWSMEAYVDYLMLIFLWKLLVLPTKCIYKQVIISRLWYHLFRTDGLHMGPVHTMIKVFTKYEVMNILQSALLSGTFMCMSRFKNCIKCKINRSEEVRFRITCELYKSLVNYKECITQIKVWPWWVYINSYRPHLGHKGRVLAKLLYEQSHIGLSCSRYKETHSVTCNACDQGAIDCVPHVLFECDALNQERDILWDRVMTDAPQALVFELNEMNSVQKTHFIMAAFNCALVPEWLCLYDQMCDLFVPNVST